MSPNDYEAHLDALLAELQNLIDVHGSRSNDVRDFVRASAEAFPEFRELGAVLIFANEQGSRPLDPLA